jgi:hypothetical protein
VDARFKEERNAAFWTVFPKTLSKMLPSLPDQNMLVPVAQDHQYTNQN